MPGEDDLRADQVVSPLPGREGLEELRGLGPVGVPDEDLRVEHLEGAHAFLVEIGGETQAVSRLDERRAQIAAVSHVDVVRRVGTEDGIAGERGSVKTQGGTSVLPAVSGGAGGEQRKKEQEEHTARRNPANGFQE